MQNQIEHTEQELKIRNYSPKTIKSYIYGLKEYFIFKKQDFENLNVDNIKNFLLFCEKNALSPQTRNLFLSVIKFFYRNVVKINEEIEIRGAKKNKSLPVVLSRPEIEKLLEVTGNIKHRSEMFVSDIQNLIAGKDKNEGNLVLPSPLVVG